MERESKPQSPPASRPESPPTSPAAAGDPTEERLRAVRAIGSVMGSGVGVEALFVQLVPQVSALMRAQRTTLFLYDPERREIWSKVAQGDDLLEVRLKLGQGLAGWVAERRQGLNIPDAYADPRFNPSVDLRSGFRTGSVLAVPLCSPKGDLLGVLQVLNRQGGPFTDGDHELLQAIATEAAFAIENAHLAEQLLSQGRWAAIGHMMAGLAHDLRNPMTSLAFHADLMARDDDREARVRRHRQMVRHLDEMAAMVADVLAFARGSSLLQPVALDAADLAREIRDDLLVLCDPRGVRLITRVDPGPVVVDRTRTRRIIYNLVKNAAEALVQGGEIRLTVAASEAGLQIVVADNGPGIPPSTLGRLYEPFAAPSNKAAGTGLGLSIVKRFVHDQGGTLELDTSLTHGTAFTILIPHLTAPAEGA